jgi:hypothetical protein
MFAALCAAGFFASNFFNPAQAFMLSGRADMNVSGADMQPASYPAPVPVSVPHFAPAAVPARTAFKLQAAKAGAQPSQYEGVWRCVSYVTNSSVPAIEPGREVDCLLQFKINAQGQLMAYWNERGWSPANCAAVRFTPVTSSIVHKSMSLHNANWAALSTDRLHMLSSSQMEGRSTVVQYRGGRPIGEYETSSVLTRVQ